MCANELFSYEARWEVMLLRSETDLAVVDLPLAPNKGSSRYCLAATFAYERWPKLLVCFTQGIRDALRLAVHVLRAKADEAGT